MTSDLPWQDGPPTAEQVAAHAAEHPYRRTLDRRHGGRWLIADSDQDGEFTELLTLRAKAGVVEVWDENAYEWEHLACYMLAQLVLPCTAEGVPVFAVEMMRDGARWEE